MPLPPSTSQVAVKRQGSRCNSIRRVRKRPNRSHLSLLWPSALARARSYRRPSERPISACLRGEAENTKRREHSGCPLRQGAVPAPHDERRPPAVAPARSPLTNRLLAGYFQANASEVPWILNGGYAMNCGSARHVTPKISNLTLYDGSRRAERSGRTAKSMRGRGLQECIDRFKDYFLFLIGQASENLDRSSGGVAPSGRSCGLMEEIRGGSLDVGSLMKCLACHLV